MNKLKLSEWAHLAEIIGAFAVVVSLLYVGYQIQLSTAERRIDSVQAITARDEQIALTYVSSETVGVAFGKVTRGEEMNQRENGVMANMLFAHLRVLEDAYNKYQQGYLEDSFMDSRKTLVIRIILGSQQVRASYEGMKNIDIFPSPFIEWFDEELRMAESASD
jgi:hypothetical protein